MNDNDIRIYVVYSCLFTMIMTDKRSLFSLTLFNLNVLQVPITTNQNCDRRGSRVRALPERPALPCPAPIVLPKYAPI